MLSVGLVLSTFFINNFTYPDFLAFVNNLLARSDLDKTIQSNISESRFFKLVMMLKIVCGFYIFMVLPAFWYYRHAFVKQVSGFFQWLAQSFKYHFNIVQAEGTLYKLMLSFVFLVYLVKSTTYIFCWPIQYDEAWTYLHFIDQPLLVTLAAPHNNHVFFTLIAWFLKFLPFDPLTAIRLLLPVVGLITGLLFHFMARQYFDKWIALVVTVCLLFSIPFTVYSLYARAYLLVVLFTVISIWAYLQITSKNSIKWHYWVLSISCVLGMYSMPSYLFVVVGIFIPLFINKFNYRNICAILPLVYVGLITGLCILLLYSPIIFSAGLSWLTESNTTPLSTYNLLQNWMLSVSYFLSGVSSCYFFVTIFIMSCLLRLFTTPGKRLAALIVWNFFLAPVFVMVLNTKIPVRTNIYLIVYLCLLIALFLKGLSKLEMKRSLALIAIATVLLAFSFLSHRNDYLQWSLKLDRVSKEIAEQLDDMGIKKVYNYFSYGKPYIEYHFRKKDKPITFGMPQKVSINYDSFSPNGTYEAVIWDGKCIYQKPDLSNYTLHYKAAERELYIKK